MTKQEAIKDFETMILNWKQWPFKGKISIPWSLHKVEGQAIKIYHPMIIQKGHIKANNTDCFNNITAAIEIAKANIKKLNNEM